MEVFQIILILILFLLICSGLFYMQKQFISFGKRVLLALLAGIVFGLILQYIFGPTSEVIVTSSDWVNIVGSGFVSLLQMLIMPLVFFAILRTFTNSTFTDGFGKIGGLVVGILVGTVIVAGAIGIFSTGIFQLEGIELTEGEAETEAVLGNEEKVEDLEGQSLPDMILSMIPKNVFLDFTGDRPTSVIAVVLFSVIVGIAFMGVRRKQPEQAEVFGKGVEAIFTVVIRIVTLVLRLTPYGIFALMVNKAATSEIATFMNLGLFIIASFFAILLMFLVHMLLIRSAGLNPLTYIRKAMPPLIFGFSSRSSAGTLPLNIETQKKSLGVSDGVADVAGAFSVTIGQNGCAGIYPAMLAVIVAPTVGIDPFTPSFILMLLAVIAIGSFGVAGVGGGATFASLIVLSTLNLPVAIVGLLISIEPLIDMARTALNVSGGMTTGVLTARLTKNFDKEIYNDKHAGVEMEQNTI